MSPRVTHETLSAAIDEFGKKALAVADESSRLRAWLTRIEEEFVERDRLFGEGAAMAPGKIQDAVRAALNGVEPPKGPGL